MTRDDLLKLLGGYATGTLTVEERDLLFAAALEDQELFDALADEQALKEMLDDPECRARLIAATEAEGLHVVPMPAKKARPRWVVPLSIAASVMVIASVTAIYLQRPETAEVAMVHAPERQEIIAPAPAPVRAPAQSARAVQRQDTEVKALKRAAPAVESLSQVAKKELPAQPADANRVSSAGVAGGAIGGVVGGVPGAVTGNLSGFAPAAPPLPSSTQPSFTQTAASPDGQIILRYSVLKRNADGEYAPVDPRTEFTAGDEIRLRLEANQTGAVSVAESGNTLFASSIASAAPLTTSTLPLDAGKPLEISFARAVPAQAPAAMAFSARRKADTVRTEAEPAKDQVTVASPIVLRITLPLRIKAQ
jgi:hypothetical protein